MEEQNDMRYVAPLDIEPNKENPRLIFEPEALKQLRESIDEAGILVPLIVYRRASDKKAVLLDGERRLICALELGLKRVPTYHIDEPDNIDNLVRMFNIHNVREKWELMPTALKLESLIDMLGTERTTKLSKKTGLSVYQVRRCKALLSFDQKYRDMVLKKILKPDFFIEMRTFLNLVQKNLSIISDKYNEKQIINKMIKKWQKGTFKDVTDFRHVSKIVRAYKEGADERKVTSVIDTFIKDDELSPEKAYESSVGTFFELKEMTHKTDLMVWELNHLDVGQEEPEEVEDFVKKLKSLQIAINNKLREIDTN